MMTVNYGMKLRNDKEQWKIKMARVRCKNNTKGKRIELPLKQNVTGS